MRAEHPVQLVLPFDWDDPVGLTRPRPARRSRFHEVAEHLRRHPGRWERIEVRDTAERAVQVVKEIHRGRPQCMAGMRARATTNRDGGFAVWACWPEPDPEAGGA
jgi:hypothetical protein